MAAAAIVWQDERLSGRRAIRIPANALTLDGFIAWAESPSFPRRGRISFIDGRLFVDMSPEEIETHNKIKVVISRVVSGLADELQTGEFYDDRTHVVNRDAALSQEPDGTYVSWASLESGRVRSIPRSKRTDEFTRIEGSPDWILEIVSRSSFHKDTVVLRERYHRARVSEYWLVDATEEEIDFQILRWETGGYVAARRQGEWQWSEVFQRWFKLERQRGRLGRWRYRLHVRETLDEAG